MDLSFPFKINDGFFSQKLIDNSILNSKDLVQWLHQLDLDNDENDTTELAIIEDKKGSNIAKNAFFARVSEENGVDKNRFFVGFPIINSRLVPELTKELEDLPNQSVPVVIAYLKCGDKRLTVGNDQAIIDLLGKFIVREHHVDPHQGFEWRQMMYEDYLTRYIDRNELKQTVEELKKIKDSFLEIYLNK